MKARARARSNIALVKYWGKRDAELNLPAVGSISITLDALWSDTEVQFDPAARADEFELDGEPRPDALHRVSRFLDIFREQAGVSDHTRTRSRNNFPTAAGLASSASGFAALAVAADAALGLNMTRKELSIIARRGSGSAARSIYGGFVEMHIGRRPDGTDSFAEPLAGSSHWPLEVLVAVTTRTRKDVSSGAGMRGSADSSPYYREWVGSHPADMQTARSAILARDFEAIADVAEHSCLKMHAAALAAAPPLIYWNGATIEGIRRIRSLRQAGVPVFFTIDAGPQIKAIYEPSSRDQVVDAIRDVPGIVDLIQSTLGPGAEVG